MTFRIVGLEPERLALFSLHVAFARFPQLALLSRATGVGLTWSRSPLPPAHAGSLGRPFSSKEATWRGYRARIGCGTELTSALRELAFPLRTSFE